MIIIIILWGYDEKGRGKGLGVRLLCDELWLGEDSICNIWLGLHIFLDMSYCCSSLSSYLSLFSTAPFLPSFTSAIGTPASSSFSVLVQVVG